jgi:hypothetical protein
MTFAIPGPILVCIAASVSIDQHPDKRQIVGGRAVEGDASALVPEERRAGPVLPPTASRATAAARYIFAAAARRFSAASARPSRRE